MVAHNTVMIEIETVLYGEFFGTASESLRERETSALKKEACQAS